MDLYGFEASYNESGKYALMISFGGGGGQKSYQSKRIPEYENAASQSIYNRAGARKVKNPEYVKYMQAQQDYAKKAYIPGSIHAKNMPPAGYIGSTPAPDEYIWDVGDAGKPVSREQATAPYKKDLDLLGKANERFAAGSTYRPTAYNKTNFNYEGLPEQYGNLAYAQGSKDVRRQGAGDLQAIKNSVGVRRPGLLLKAGQKNQRDVAEQLAKMRGDIDLETMRQNVDLKTRQQQDQAAENMRAAEFGDSQSRYGSEDALRYLQGLQQGAGSKVELESNLTKQEREYQDQVIKMFMDMYFGSADAMKAQKGQWKVGIDNPFAPIGS